MKLHGIWIHQVTREMIIGTFEDCGIYSIFSLPNRLTDIGELYQWDFWATLPGGILAGTWASERAGKLGT